MDKSYIHRYYAYLCSILLFCLLFLFFDLITFKLNYQKREINYGWLLIFSYPLISSFSLLNMIILGMSPEKTTKQYEKIQKDNDYENPFYVDEIAAKKLQEYHLKNSSPIIIPEEDEFEFVEEEEKIEEDKIEEDKIEEDKIEENKIEEDKIEEEKEVNLDNLDKNNLSDSEDQSISSNSKTDMQLNDTNE